MVIDLIIVDERARQPIGRTCLTVVIEVFTRCMHGSKPRLLYLDNAAEFRSRALRRGCEQRGIQLSYRPPGFWRKAPEGA